MRPDCRRHYRCVGYVSRAPNPSGFQFHTDFPVRRGQQRRALQQSSRSCGLIKSFRLPKQAQVSRVSFKRNIRLSFALRSEAAQLSSHRARMDLRFGTFHSGRALALRTLPPPVASTGPATLDRCCDRNVVAPEGYSKCFFAFQSGFMGAIFGRPRPCECRRCRTLVASPALTLPMPLNLQRARSGHTPLP
jgi:hypothetical protein